MKLAFFGASLVSTKRNGAAAYFRGILRALHERGFECLFYEPDAVDRQSHRDIADPEWCQIRVWQPTEPGALAAVEHARNADLIVKASGVGVLDSLLEAAVLSLQSPRTLVAYWDMDAPATLARMQQDPLDGFRTLIPSYDLVLTYGGGPKVVAAYERLGAKRCVPIYNAVDPTTHHPVPVDGSFVADLGFLANRVPDREGRTKEFFFDVAHELTDHRFLLGGSGWNQAELPPNITYAGHVYARHHNAFNCSPLAVLYVCREGMAITGYSPATRVFESAGAGGCLISDAWEGIDAFLTPDEEVLLATCSADVIEHLRGLNDERARQIGQRARRRVLAEHTYAHRADRLCRVLGESGRRPRVHPDNVRRAGLSIVVVGLSITSSWSNGHATTYRGLVRELVRRGHDVTFLERHDPWHAEYRDLRAPHPGAVDLYGSLADLDARHRRTISGADVVVVGSSLPCGREIGDWVLANARGVTAFYDLDTPVTFPAVQSGQCGYLRRDQIPAYGLYLSSSGGPILARIEDELGALAARPLYGSVDPEIHTPRRVPRRWDVSFMGTYGPDRQPALDRLLLTTALACPERRFAIAGARYPQSIEWPENVTHKQHVPPSEHAAFYGASALALNLTRRDVGLACHSPSVRLFEAAACGVPIASDRWPGLETFFEPGRELAVVDDTTDVIALLNEPAGVLERMADRARRRVLAEHSAAVRAATFERYVLTASAREQRRTA